MSLEKIYAEANLKWYFMLHDFLHPLKQLLYMLPKKKKEKYFLGMKTKIPY